MRGQDGNRVSRAALRALLAFQGIQEAPPVPVADVVARYSDNTALNFVDAWNLTVALQAGVPLVPFDVGLRRAFRRATAAPKPTD